MKPTTIATVLLSATPALGARWTRKRREAHEARKALEFPLDHTHSSPMMPVDESVERDLTSNKHISYSQNWAGAALVSANFTSVTGTITVPTPTSANNGVQSAGSAWVGIDGDTCTSAILQTGIDWYVQGSTISYDAWYEWYPNYSYNFASSSIRLLAGDTLRLTVTATAPTAGTAVIENLTSGQSAAHTFLTSDGNGQLCGQNAEWIVEDFQTCDATGTNCGLVPFANFGSLNFASATAVQGGNSITPSTANEGLVVIDMYQGGQVVAGCSVSGSTVACTHP